MNKKTLSLGFTLIEVLVVIAVIAVIAAILFPSFFSAREKARQSTCISNLNQVGLAWFMYAQDYDETCVQNSYIDSGGNYHTWFGTADYATNTLDPSKGLIAQYTTGNHVIQDCPSENNEPIFNGNKASFGYAVNENLYPQQYESNLPYNEQNESINIAQISVPDDTILISDSAFLYNGNLYSQLQLYAPSNQIYGVPVAHALHHNHADILWFDGHVKSFPLAYVTSPDIDGDTPGILRSNNLGYLLKPACTLGDTSCQDYYYAISK